MPPLRQPMCSIASILTEHDDEDDKLDYYIKIHTAEISFQHQEVLHYKNCTLCYLSKEVELF
jgi:hypothetical protein